MLKTTAFKLCSTLVSCAALAVAAGCSGNTSTIDWAALTRVSNPTSLQRALTLDNDKMSLVGAGLEHYRKLLQTRTTENQDRAKVLYNRIEMHALNSVILAGDFNRLAELEMLHLGWATSLVPPYTQVMERRVQAFNASAAIFRTTPLMRPTAGPTEDRRSISYGELDDAYTRLNELCMVATNPWSMDRENAVALPLLEWVQQMSAELSEQLQTVRIASGVKHTVYTTFSDSTYAKAFANLCRPKKASAAATPQ